MDYATFQYPIRDKPTSRVALSGPNGAAKSTAIKLLIGEI
jgi:ABC-type Mn2+/Zn2+ transport system ATPase subunit